jgi:PTS system fructose-specific IIC component
MRIDDLLKPQSILIGGTPKDKNDAIHQLVGLMAKGGNVVDEEAYEKAVFAREAEFSTGMDDGIAIPHAKTSAVSAPGLAAMTVPDGVDFDSTDGQPSTLIFLIAAPEGEANVHLQVLSRLSTLLIDEDFCAQLRAAKTAEEFRSIVDATEDKKLAAESEKAAKAAERDAAGYDVVAITACPTGIAHTYMAAESLEKQAKAMGVKIKVETQGSEGAKNVLSAEDIAGAKGVIIAADKKVELGRFDGKPLYSTSVTRGINEPKELIDTILDGKADVYHGGEGEAASASDEEKEGLGHRFYKDLMNGVSHMLPFVVGGGILMALSFLLDSAGMGTAAYGHSTPVAAFFNLAGNQAFNFMLPVLAGYIAESIADRPGLAPGFVAGWIAKEGYTFAYCAAGLDDTAVELVSAGFLGALLGGFVAGWIVNLLKKAFSGMPHSLDGIKPVLLYPLCGIFLTALVMMLVNPVMAAINVGIKDFLNGLSGASSVVLGAIVGGMMATDMGGPINKAAYVFGMGSLEDAAAGGSLIMAAVMVGGMVPPLAIALSTTFFKNRWTPDERKAGVVNYVMGLSFITEGAIPFAAADPGRILPSCIAGSAVAGALSAAFGCASPAPHGGIWVIAVIQNPVGYLIALVAGSLVGMLVLTALKKPLPAEESGLEPKEAKAA